MDSTQGTSKNSELGFPKGRLHQTMCLCSPQQSNSSEHVFFGTWHEVPGTRYLAPGSGNLPPGTRYLVPGMCTMRYLVPLLHNVFGPWTKYMATYAYVCPIYPYIWPYGSCQPTNQPTNQPTQHPIVQAHPAEAFFVSGKKHTLAFVEHVSCGFCQCSSISGSIQSPHGLGSSRSLFLFGNKHALGCTWHQVQGTWYQVSGNRCIFTRRSSF